MDIYMPLTQTVWAAVAVVARLPAADEAALADTGNLPAAIEHYKNALRIDPNLSAAQQGLAQALRPTTGEAK